MSEENNIEEEVKKEDLKELLDTTYPLLQRFRDTCPGTYKHSQSVASMIEGVALSLGLDVTKLKVAAQYHDIGKMFNPKYFTENQLEDENPHDNLKPLISYSIITRHVSDSVVILINDPGFPRDIIEIISQHHGTSILKYFLKKAGSEVEDVFRYKTSTPTCVESAILMICDHIEATSRSLMQANKFSPIDVIETTINGLIDDGQLDNVVMRLGDLKKIKEALAKELEGTYQKRVDYDKSDKEGK
jgi:putative nucleotidyltransferase with HDIG domain